MGVKIFDRESSHSGNIGDVFTTLDFYHNLTEAAWCGAMDGARATLGLGFSFIGNVRTIFWKVVRCGVADIGWWGPNRIFRLLTLFPRAPTCSDKGPRLRRDCRGVI